MHMLQLHPGRGRDYSVVSSPNVNKYIIIFHIHYLIHYNDLSYTERERASVLETERRDRVRVCVCVKIEREEWENNVCHFVLSIAI